MRQYAGNAVHFKVNLNFCNLWTHAPIFNCLLPLGCIILQRKEKEKRFTFFFFSFFSLGLQADVCNVSTILDWIESLYLKQIRQPWILLVIYSTEDFDSKFNILLWVNWESHLYEERTASILFLIHFVHFLFWKISEPCTRHFDIYIYFTVCHTLWISNPLRTSALTIMLTSTNSKLRKALSSECIAPCLFLHRIAMSYMTEACDSVINGLSVTGQWLQLAHKSMVHCPTVTMQSLQLSHHSTTRNATQMC